MILPDFDSLLPVPFQNHVTGEACHLRRADCIRYTDAHYKQITSICNEPLVYDVLFRRRRQGKPYKLTDAHSFTQWGVEGWRLQRYYLFFVTTADNVIAAALDIKSNGPVSAEIGYWCSSHHRGIMTNAVAALTNVMAHAGYVKAHALVLPSNDRSANVLRRNNFELLGPVTQDLVTYNKYNKALVSDG